MADPITDYNTAADGFADVLGRRSPTPRSTRRAKGGRSSGSSTTSSAGRATTPTSGAVHRRRRIADLNARYAANRAALVEAISKPGALEEMIPKPFGEGEIPRGLMFGIFTSDTLIHTWDLGQAIGEDVRPDADLLQRRGRTPSRWRRCCAQPGIFGPKVDVGDDASPQVQALAFFGRDAR